MSFRKSQSEASRAAPVRARLRAAIAAGVSIDRVSVASGSLSWATVDAFLKGKTNPQARVIKGVSDALDRIESRASQTESVPNPVPSFRDTWAKPAIAPRQFNSEAERISYALGVLDMAGTSNRLVIETSNEVSRAISAASAALLAPVTGPAPVVPAKSLAELLADHSSAQQVLAAREAKPGGKKRRATGQQSG